MNIGQAIEALTNGAQVRRAIWPPGDHVKIADRPSPQSMRYVEKCGAGQTERTMSWFTADIVADDWGRV